MCTSSPPASSFVTLAAIAIVAASTLAPRTARADAKQACVASADQGQSLRDDGKYTRAREAFASCARDTCPPVIVKSCAQWLHDLAEKTPTVVFGAKDDSGADVVRARVTIDGASLASALDGNPVEVDPGEHVVRVEREGSVAVEQRVVFRVGEKNRILTVTLRSAVVAHPPPTTAVAGEPPRPSDDVSPRERSTARNVTALSLVVAGALAAGAGVYFGLQSKSQADQAATLRAGMPPFACVSSSSAACQQLSDAVDAQNRDASVSTVLVIAGGVLAAGGIVTWLAWPKASNERATSAELVPMVGPRGAALGLRGRF